MTFEEILDQAIAMLRRRGRMTYRTLQRQFALDEDALNDLKGELLYAHPEVRDDAGHGLVWTGEPVITPPVVATPASQPEREPLSYTPPYLAEKIFTARSALAGERKQVTVLFADLKDSTELIRGLDPEAAQQLLDPAIHCMMDAVHRFEGTVNQVLGDGVWALFGAPIAHEAHAVRACYAALAMQATMRAMTDEVRRTWGLELRMRVGLNAGEVVVRAIGNDLHMDYSAVGETTHLAARMEQLATPGTIRLSAATLRLVEGYIEVTPLGPVPVKGLPEPVEVYELLRAGVVHSRLQAAVARGLTRFVGREAELEHLGQALARAGAGHGQVVAGGGEAGRGEDPQWHACDPPQRRRRTLEAIKHLLLRESQVQPLLLVFEDLHWIDSETQALLDSLVESLPTARLLLLVNYRPEYQHTWGGKTYYRQLRIDPLPPATAEELLRGLLGDAPELRPLERLLTDRTEGNPFFLEETVRTLVETRVLVGERGAYRLAKDVGTIRVAPTVQAVLAARIDRLTPEEKRLLQTAAVIGKDVPFALLQAIADAPEDALRRSLASLQAAEFLYESRLFPDLEYTFKHALTHEVAYGSLPQERRRALHARIVEAIEHLDSARLSEHVEQLAHHAFQGEVWGKALTYLRQAGAKAAARSAYRGAVAWLTQALRALERLPQGPAPTAEAGHPKAERFGPPFFLSVGSRSWLGRCLGEMGQFSEGESVALEGLRRAEDLDHPLSVVIACFGLGRVYLLQGVVPKAIATLERGLQLARSLAFEAWLPLSAAQLGHAYTLAGRPADGIALLEECVRIQTSGKRLPELALSLTWPLSLTWLAEAYLHNGRFEDAATAADDALRLARERDERGNEGWVMWALGEIASHREPGDVGEAEAHYLEAGARATELGMRPLVAHCRFGLGKLYRRAGKREPAREHLATATTAFREMGMQFWLEKAETELKELC